MQKQYSCFSLLPQSDLFCVLSVAAGYCCSLSHSETHTRTHTHTQGATPVEQGSAPSTVLYLTTRNIHNRQTDMPPAGFEPAIPATDRPQTHTSDRAAPGMGTFTFHSSKWHSFRFCSTKCQQCPQVWFLLYPIGSAHNK